MSKATKNRRSQTEEMRLSMRVVEICGDGKTESCDQTPQLYPKPWGNECVVYR